MHTRESIAFEEFQKDSKFFEMKDVNKENLLHGLHELSSMLFYMNCVKLSMDITCCLVTSFTCP